jgi:hypothetical protein
MPTFTCPRCGLQLILKTEPPKFGDLKCDDCGGVIELQPRVAQDVIQFAGASELEAGAQAIAAYEDGALVWQHSEPLGYGTNQVAELTAVLRAMEMCDPNYVPSIYTVVVE